jgi:hypothetical protein
LADKLITNRIRSYKHILRINDRYSQLEGSEHETKGKSSKGRPETRWEQETGKYLTQKEGTYVMDKSIQIHNLSSIILMLLDAIQSRQWQLLEDK